MYLDLISLMKDSHELCEFHGYTCCLPDPDSTYSEKIKRHSQKCEGKWDEYKIYIKKYLIFMFNPVDYEKSRTKFYLGYSKVNTIERGPSVEDVTTKRHKIGKKYDRTEDNYDQDISKEHKAPISDHLSAKDSQPLVSEFSRNQEIMNSIKILEKKFYEKLIKYTLIQSREVLKILKKGKSKRTKENRLRGKVESYFSKTNHGFIESLVQSDFEKNIKNLIKLSKEIDKFPKMPKKFNTKDSMTYFIDPKIIHYTIAYLEFLLLAKDDSLYKYFNFAFCEGCILFYYKEKNYQATHPHDMDTFRRTLKEEFFSHIKTSTNSIIYEQYLFEVEDLLYFSDMSLEWQTEKSQTIYSPLCNDSFDEGFLSN